MEALVSLLLQGSRKRVSAGRTEGAGAASGRRSEDGCRLDRWPVAGGLRAVAPPLALGPSVARFASLAPFSSAFSSPPPPPLILLLPVVALGRIVPFGDPALIVVVAV